MGGKVFQILTNLPTTDKPWGFRGQLRFEMTFYNHLVYSPCSGKSQVELLSITFPSQILKYPRMGVSTASLGNLFQCLVILIIKKSFFCA